MPVALLDIPISRREYDQLHADIAAYLAQQAAPAPPPAGRLDAAALIQQAGIITGPAPRPKRRILGRRPTPTQVGVAGHLDAVVRIITVYGWAQHTRWDAQRRCCIVGAQSLAVHLGYGDRAIAGQAGDWLNRQLGGGIDYVNWQNNRWRTKPQVLDMLRTAADNARKAGA
ncbi:hypothetical protein [Streptomyces sp. MP131-18]|uniref:DUF6197 family protein n=1 Tax=Streptomyces sp. MP131-18 TaxID=1857892 RepID=UPI00097BC707|nr:hypothetical protein [Streptomyces sp. MP131-18]ONK09456.1 hypothetical protein STBA_01560 [Streptomyces sp. MP131-18]